MNNVVVFNIVRTNNDLIGFGFEFLYAGLLIQSKFGVKLKKKNNLRNDDIIEQFSLVVE